MIEDTQSQEDLGQWIDSRDGDLRNAILVETVQERSADSVIPETRIFIEGMTTSICSPPQLRGTDKMMVDT